MKHKSLVDPVFLTYNHVSLDNGKTPLMSVTAAMVQSVGSDLCVDAVQPMKSGWWIYLRTAVDHELLIQKGLTLNGKHIQLCSEIRPADRKTVRVTLRDLPLHTVDNSDILDALSDNFTVTSEVQYSTIWHNGKPTSIRNGDRYVYMHEDTVAKLPDTLKVGEYTARIFKPPALTRCRRCGGTGHRQND